MAGAAPSGHLPEVTAQPSRFLIDRVAKGAPASFCVYMPAKEWFLSKADFSLHVRAALNEWTKGTAQRIRAAGRAKEFKDILPLLEKARFQELPACNLSKHPKAEEFFKDASSGPHADIAIIASPRYCAEGLYKFTSFFMLNFRSASPFIGIADTLPSLVDDVSYGVRSVCRTPQDLQTVLNAAAVLNRAAEGSATWKDRQDLWKINRCFSYDGPTLYTTLVHELGHAFGLADEYGGGNADPLFSSVETQDGIMKYAYDVPGCSETDAVITLLDRALNKKRTFTSFCQNGVVFKNGVQQVQYITPTQLILQPEKTVLLSLTSKSAKEQTLLAEIVEKNFSAPTLEVFQFAGVTPPPSSGQVYSGGRQKNDGTRVGVWEFIFSREGETRAWRVKYDKDGKLLSVFVKNVPLVYVQRRFERMQKMANRKIARIKNELKKSL